MIIDVLSFARTAKCFGLASALCTGVIPAWALERVADTVVNPLSKGSQAEISNTLFRANCINGALDNSIMSCPSDCMIPTSTVSITTIDVCDAKNNQTWSCMWPTQWVTMQDSCNNIGFGTGWEGTATIRREYEIQQCGQVVIPTGKPPILVDVSQCTRNREEEDLKACPDRANAGLAKEIGGPVGDLWKQATSTETNWQGRGVTLARPLFERLTLDGEIDVVSRGDWRVKKVECTRQVQRQIQVPCDGTMMEVCIEREPISPTTVVTTTTVMVDGVPREVTQTIEVQHDPLPPVCETVPAGNLAYTCTLDFKRGSIDVSHAHASWVSEGDLQVLRREWSYTPAKYLYSKTCPQPYTTHYNSGVSDVTMGLKENLTEDYIISSVGPWLVQQYCSQAGMNQRWTVQDWGYGSEPGGDGGDGDGDCGGADGGDGDGAGDGGDAGY